MSSQFVPLTSKHPDGILRPVILGRKSKPNPQNENESIEASMEDAEKWLESVYKGPAQITRLGEQISGMLVDRATIRQTEDMVATGEVDLVLVEDIGRLFRNPRHMWAFVQDLVDAEVRFVAVADNIDTFADDWETAMAIAAVRHGFAVPDARRRVRRSAVFSFRKGGNVQKVKFGFRKLSREEANSGEFGPVGLRIAKTTELMDTIKSICEKVKDLKNFRSYDDIANWLNDQGISPGPYCKLGRWTGRLVASVVQDDGLAGYRTHQKVEHTRILKTGKYKRRRNEAPEKIRYKELAHLTIDEFKDLQEAVRERAEDQKPRRGREHPRYGVPRNKAIFPAQHMTCDSCKEEHYPCARGSFKCQRSFKKCRANRCWNHVQVEAKQAREQIVPWVIQVLSGFPNFREIAVDECWNEFQRLLATSNRSVAIFDDQIKELERQKARVLVAIRKASELAVEDLTKELMELNDQLAGARKKQEAARKRIGKASDFLSRDDVAAHLTDAALFLAASSFKFADWLRSILTRFEIVPIQAIDCGLVRPRAYCTLEFSIENEHTGEMSTQTFNARFDLFEKPEHVKHLAACLEARKTPSGKKRPYGYGAIARKLGINRMTVKRALALARQMELEGLNEPYRELREPPARASRWRSA